MIRFAALERGKRAVAAALKDDAAYGCEFQRDGAGASTDDRLIHNAHRIELKGDSMRQKKRKARIEHNRNPRNHFPRQMTAAQGPAVAYLSGTC
ncbi:hypothetical protein HUK65_14675 [Rhodobacteraceae bacterium 2376]|uniref:Uncharacterized protein n=1 Tax=Rhabdonatronobacter sediminivivens TaxID=2743469 RepID=A0A7Z0I1I8_9RHOB|nr:hypothetical protein [Rhabdonatronobacter sediminivivens]NYS26232.1 hypothetical protein [Rhabdonatronobacter sediminivivens]